MTKKIAIELEPHKVEFSVPDDFDVTVDENKISAVAIYKKTRMIYAEIKSPYSKLTDFNEKDMMEEINMQLPTLLDMWQDSPALNSKSNTRPTRTSDPLRNETLKNHEGRYLEFIYDTGSIVGRGLYWLNEDTVLDIYFLYHKLDEEMQRIIEQTKSSATITTAPTAPN